ncbi:hypothetical protein Pla144_33820 [Bythopirellula polymerisocia]|uniref:Uncharacterized protein n=1 Tax=Bythopirellula polymerisocia TaxID=2528003 RepID=A0A5C6CJ81_9BACT|nr:hypothetical protein Pla144_33820 [Bythopirellula polymerisocia]
MSQGISVVIRLPQYFAEIEKASYKAHVLTVSTEMKPASSRIHRSGRGVSGLSLLLPQFFHRSATAEFHSVLLIDQDDLHFHAVTY